jgi:hypothetical protein
MMNGMAPQAGLPLRAQYRAQDYDWSREPPGSTLIVHSFNHTLITKSKQSDLRLIGATVSFVDNDFAHQLRWLVGDELRQLVRSEAEALAFSYGLAATAHFLPGNWLIQSGKLSNHRA